MKLLAKKKNLLILFIPLLIVLAALPSWYFYSRYKSAQAELKKTDAAAKAQSQEMIKKVGKLILLPKDEEPTVATINDQSKLSGQPFFAQAKKGDIVLLYTEKAKKAFLYRPETNMIINVAPLTISNNNSGVLGETSKTLSFDVRNGTKIVGLAERYVKEIKNKWPEASVSKSDAKGNYDKSFLVDNVPAGNPLAASISATLNIPPGTLPSVEATSAAQFTIILGADQK